MKRWWRKRHLRHRHAPGTEPKQVFPSKLRWAIDDLWSNIEHPRVLDPETIKIAQDNHERLWHEQDD